MVYASGPFGGIPAIFKSTDDGVTETDLIACWRSRLFETLVDPHNPTILYAGSAPGLLKSTDGGVSWNPLAVPSNFAVSNLTADPVQPNTLYVQFYQSLYKTY